MFAAALLRRGTASPALFQPARAYVSRTLGAAAALPSAPHRIEIDKDGDQMRLVVPRRPIVPFIEGDGVGADVWAAARRVLDAAVAAAYGDARRIEWMEVYAGEKAFHRTGEWLPRGTMEAFRDYSVGIKGPLTTPVGSGIRSLNVALRQELDLYVCQRPVRHFANVPSPVRKPQAVDVVVFRENTEDIYAGIEMEQGTPECAAFARSLQELFPNRFRKVRFPDTSAFGVKPVSKDGSQRLVRAALQYALESGRKSVTMVAKGNIMKHTEGAFVKWGYAVATSPEFRSQCVTERESHVLANADANSALTFEENARAIHPGFDSFSPEQQEDAVAEVRGIIESIGSSHGWGKFRSKLLVRDVLADISFQQVLTRPETFDVVATLNLNGDYLSDALAAQVGGIGIAPGGNMNPETGHAIFEATHGTAPKYANLDKVNPTSMILSGEMLLRYLGWGEAADEVIAGVEGALLAKMVTYDFHRLMPAGATLVSCSEFAQVVIKNMPKRLDTDADLGGNYDSDGM